LSPEALQRLRRRLTAYVALALGVAIAVPSATLCILRADRAEERFDARVAGAVRDVDAVLFEEGGQLNVDTYSSTPRTAGTPLTAVLDPQGELLAGDRELPVAIRRRAQALARAATDDVVAVPRPGDDLRLAARGIEGEEGTLGIALAFAPTGAVADEVRTDTLQLGAIALAGWALAVAITVVLISRALGPAGAAARREQAFLADAAHELRTPWAIVRGRAEQALRDGPRTEDMRFVAATATAASSAISDMLELGRLDAGQALGERVPVAIDALVDTCVGEREEEARRAGVRVERRLDERAVVRGDERLLTRAVGNLLDNALRHGGAGSLLEVTVAVDAGEVVVSVADRGPGVAPGQQERIFDRFHRGSAAAAGGAGLGLPIAALVAAAHGGKLTLAPPNADGRPGARFEMRLPALTT